MVIDVVEQPVDPVLQQGEPEDVGPREHIECRGKRCGHDVVGIVAERVLAAAAAKRAIQLVEMAGDLSQRPRAIVVAAVRALHRPVGQARRFASDLGALDLRRRDDVAGRARGRRRLDRPAVAHDLVVEQVELLAEFLRRFPGASEHAPSVGQWRVSVR